MKKLILVVLLALAPLSWGSLLSFDEFYETLDNPNTEDVAYTFANGVLEGIMLMNLRAEQQNGIAIFCPPPRLSINRELLASQTRELVERGRDAFDRSLAWTHYVIPSLRYTFPCE